MRSVRNWWIETTVDGAKKTVAAGPKPKDGGFSLTIYQRNEGQSVTAVVISGHADGYGRLWLTVRVNDKDGAAPIVATFDTER